MGPYEYFLLPSPDTLLTRFRNGCNALVAQSPSIARGGIVGLPSGIGCGTPTRVRESMRDGSFTTNWVDPDSAARYGTSVYERCGQKKA